MDKVGFNDNSINQPFKSRILWRVYLVWFFKRIAPLMVVQIVAIVLVFKIFAQNVFVSKVLQNIGIAANNGYWSVFKYLVLSFLQAHLIVQFSILLFLGFGALVIRDIIRSVLVRMVMKRKGDK
ncbi:MAG: hypothetical protein Athens071426_422 [Parcubacteria group bacterium Athens0714_26]|nr:MAG: hypothetical protein Athens101426_629 [Parcubacteria group bacterium Athens1014_26]TSD02661.1 MAG: hypothetical protein Athens071426_422 [Parcubacteria group bacterium Athens0714_26]